MNTYTITYVYRPEGEEEKKTVQAQDFVESGSLLLFRGPGPSYDTLEAFPTKLVVHINRDNR